MPSPDAVDIIATKILVDAKGATEALKAVGQQVTSTQGKFTALRQLISAVSKQMNGDINGATSAVQRFSKALNVNPSAVRAVGSELQKTAAAAQQVERSSGNAFTKLITGAHTARIAIGALVSMILFQFLQAVQNVFSTAINNLQEFEATLYRISNVERELSLKGIEISIEGLKKGVQDIKALLPIFSEEDISQMIGSLATATSHLGLSEEQILKLGKAIAILNVQSVEEETLLQTQAKIVNAIVTSQAKGVGNLGITFSKNRIEAEALNLGLLEVGETMADLSDAEKTQAKLAIVLDKAGIEGAANEFQALNGYLESSDAKSQELKATWNDFLKEVAIQFAPLIIEFLQSSIDLVKGWSESLERNKEIWTFISSVLSGIQRVQHDINSENAEASGLEKTVNKLLPFLGKMEDFKIGNVFKSFTEGFNDAQERAENFGAFVETPTSKDVDIEVDVEGEEEAKKALEEIDQKIEDILVDARQAREDLDLKLEQKQQDLDTEYLRKTEDAARDHTQKLSDIETDARQKAEDAKRKSREDEKKAERDLLQKLKELRQKFLLDLEDALRERDARQVLRLIKEYKLEKQNILDRKKLDDQERQDRLAEELRNIEIERQRKIEQENIDYQRKLADLALQKQREQEELALWYAREQEDIQRNIEQKLEKLLAGYIAEGQLTEEQQAAITAILAKHFGNNMALVDQMVAYMQARFAQMGQMAGGFFGGVSAPGLAAYQNSERGTSAGRRGGGRRMAQGGTLIADRPTTVTFGEAGLEAGTFTPLGRNGRDVNKVFGDMGGLTGGALELGIMLSPELRAEIINSTMDKVALKIEHTQRERR